MAIWAGGPHQRLVAIKNLDPVTTSSDESSKNFITQIVMVDEHYFFFNNLGKILLLNMSGEMLRFIPLDSLFNEGEFVCSSEVIKNVMILGTN